MLGLITRRHHQPRHTGEHCRLCGRRVVLDARGRCPLGHQVGEPVPLDPGSSPAAATPPGDADEAAQPRTIHLDPAWSTAPPPAAAHEGPPAEVDAAARPGPGSRELRLPALEPAPPPPVPAAGSQLDGPPPSHVLVDDTAFATPGRSALDVDGLGEGPVRPPAVVAASTGPVEESEEELAAADAQQRGRVLRAVGALLFVAALLGIAVLLAVGL